ncbi:Flavohemoprotein [Metarhizium anisopliae]
MALTYSQCQKIRATVPALNARGEEIIASFYQSLLRGHPELRSYFNTANQLNKLQPKAMASLIIQFANNVSHIYELIPKMERICQKHCSVGVQPHHYKIMGAYLLEAFTGILDPSMTPDAKMAWNNAYWMLANMFIAREKQLYKTFGPWTDWRPFDVADRVHEGENVVSFYLKPRDKKPLPPFMPGQYVSIRVAVPGKEHKQIRQYALSEAPNPDYYRITVQRNRGAGGGGIPDEQHQSACPYASPPGAVSNHLIDSAVAGDTLELSHPAGHIFLDTKNLSNAPLVLFSTGIGATPMLSILNFTAKEQPGRPVSWINASQGAMPFQARVDSLAARRKNLRNTTLGIAHDGHASADCDGQDDARLDLVSLRPDDLFLRNECTEYFVCGAENITVQFVEFLERHGIDRARIHCELQTVARY